MLDKEPKLAAVGCQSTEGATDIPFAVSILKKVAFVSWRLDAFEAEDPVSSPVVLGHTSRNGVTMVIHQFWRFFHFNLSPSIRLVCAENYVESPLTNIDVRLKTERLERLHERWIATVYRSNVAQPI